MRILLTNAALHARGGTESYLETVAPALRALEHDVHLYSPALGDVAAGLRALGFPLYDDVAALPDDIDVIHGQHANAVAGVRTRFPTIPLVFVSHSWFVPIEDPLADLGISAAVALNDRVEARLRVHAATADLPVHRLRQPVEVSFADVHRIRLPQRPRWAVSVSRKLDGRLRELREACARHGIELISLGGPGADGNPLEHVRAADIVFAIGRSALEGMAAGRAVVIVDETTQGGWVTPASYDSLERDGFTGLGGTHDQPVSDVLAEYSADHGVMARSLVLRHHASQAHAEQLVAIYRSVLGAERAATTSPSLAGLALRAQAMETRALAAEWAAAGHLRQIAQLQAEVEGLRNEAPAATPRVGR
jgi:hypothetical protein